MTTYSLLQVSLDQTIDWESLEMASDGVPSLARADCAHLQRDLFGIVVSNLPLQEATAFQAELKRRGFPTDLVADHELPVLHEPFTIQRIEIKEKALLLMASIGTSGRRVEALRHQEFLPLSQKLRRGDPLAFLPPDSAELSCRVGIQLIPLKSVPSIEDDRINPPPANPRRTGPELAKTPRGCESPASG